MGTNFYFISNDEHIDVHIGKRSAAGPFCWDCGMSLCAAGNHEVHNSSARFLKECPVCGNPMEEESLSSSTAGRELGFNKKTPCRKTGVASCSSFSWAISPGLFYDYRKAPNLTIKDEYGRSFSSLDFSKILSECPIMFFDSIGKDFC